MGYSHYWRLKSDARQSSYKEALADIRKIIKDNISILANGMGDKDSLPKTQKEISFNGIEDESHETFFLPTSLLKFDYGRDDGWSFDFCKTAQKEYDKIVVACLCILKFHLKDKIQIESDGDQEDLREGIELASKYLNAILLNPFNK